MQNYYNLKIPVRLLKDEVTSNTQRYIGDFETKKKHGWALNMYDSTDFLTDDAIQFFKDIKVLLLPTCLFFKGDSNDNSSIHIDGHPSLHNWAINIAWGSSSSEMIWYEPLSEFKKTAVTTSVGTLFIKYTPEEVREIERTTVTDSCLVRVDIPHRVFNYDLNNTRWCLSIRGVYRFKNWNETVNFFKPFII